MPSRITADKKNRMIELKRQGYSINAIRRMVGSSERTVKNHTGHIQSPRQLAYKNNDDDGFYKRLAIPEFPKPEVIPCLKQILSPCPICGGTLILDEYGNNKCESCDTVWNLYGVPVK